MEQKQEIMRRMRSSSNVASLLHGDHKNSDHYIDQLDRFSRNFASHDKHQRQAQYRKKMEIMEKRRNFLLQKQQSHQQEEDRLARKYFQDIDHSQKLHQARLKKTAHTNSLPFNPITHVYQNNVSGAELKKNQDDARVNHLVRAHNMITRGTSGYNLINGRYQPVLETLIPTNMQNQFNEKLARHYSKYRLSVGDTTEIHPN